MSAAPAKAAAEEAGSPRTPHAIEYLSPPASVQMADRWFEISTTNHFWVKRRFAVLQHLAGELIAGGGELAEIGCGHGLLQRQIEDRYGKIVTGFDLNEFALKLNVSRRSRVCCYNVYRQDAALQGRFDMIFLFDVLEHLEEEKRFLDAVLFHLAPQGKLVINVPAGQWLYSAYDRAQGHARRYSGQALLGAGQRSELECLRWTYWGLPLVPSVMVRKALLAGETRADKTVSTGFELQSEFVNRVMSLLASCEPLPQKLLGTSVMGVFRRAGMPASSQAFQS